MKREVKFRAKDADTGRWRYGDLLTSNGTDFEISDWDDVSFGRYSVTEETAGQFTGLTDKNGNLMYEGDVVRNGDGGYLYVIEWHDCGLFGKQIGSSSYIGLTVWRDRLVVIGNIHDNPELLKVKKPEPVAKNGLLPHEFRIRALYDNGYMSVKGHLYIAEYIKKDRKKYIRVWDENSVIDNGKRRYGTYCDMDLGILGNDVVCPIYEIVKE